MGAAASIPDELTQEEAIILAGDTWDEKLLALWPEGAEKITKDQLVTLVKDAPGKMARTARDTPQERTAPDMSAKRPVRCYARVRPALAREVDGHRRMHRCVAREPDKPVLHVASKRQGETPAVIESDGSTASSEVRPFALDGVFEEERCTADVYDDASTPLTTMSWIWMHATTGIRSAVIERAKPTAG